MMFKAVRTQLGNAGINYGDVFTMRYKRSPEKRVGILYPVDASLEPYGYESQDTMWCYFHDQDFKGLAPATWNEDLNRPVINDSIYLHDPIVNQQDPYLIQRVSSLIMAELVDYQVVYRYPTNFVTPIIQRIFGFFLFTTRNGQRIGGIWDD